jgi:hypothetical protein
VRWASSNGRGRSGMYGLSLLRHGGAWRQSGTSALVESRLGVRSRSISDVVVPSSFAMLARKVNLGMDDAHVAGQSIIAREGLFLNAQCTANFLLAHVVNRVFVSGEIVRPREHDVSWLAGGRIPPLALVWAGQGVPRK